MSRGNLIQGQASGKLGSTVLMVRNGLQLARIYTTAGARGGEQASESARIQRVKFGSASNEWSCYKYVCTRMYRKGRKSSQSDYNYFVKRNNMLLPYLTKQENADGVHVLMPGQFSEGNLGRIELLCTFNAEATESFATLRVSDLQVPGFVSVSWSSNVSVLKEALQAAYPSARKITYLFSLANETTIEEEGTTFVSQQISHFPIVIDLFEEITRGENNTKINEFFAAQVNNAALKALFESQTSGTAITYGKGVFLIYNWTATALETLSKLGVLVFATDDNVSDCYTTSLPASNVNPTSGVFAVWASYRTQESLRIAADSYGYQSGVMRDFVAAAGNDLEEAAQNYARALRSVDAAAADEYLANLAAAGGARARTVRTATAEE